MRQTFSNDAVGASGSNGFGPLWLSRYGRRDVPGEIVTFYSYKGGTGRSMALANCAGLMAEHWPTQAKPMLLIDFDLEAPGLHQYLRAYLPAPAQLQDRPGTLELFEDLRLRVQGNAQESNLVSEERPRLDDLQCQQVVDGLNLDPYLVQTQMGTVWLMKAGRFDDSYGRRLADMNWQALYADAPGIFRAIAARLARDYACTLIDARTGLSDTSGICTMLLPDVLTVVFTPNRQSLAGVEQIVQQAQNYRAQSVDLRPLRTYPLPSRVEQTSEHFRLAWRKGVTQDATFGDVEGYQPLFERLTQEDRAHADTLDALSGLDRYFDAVQVPHSPDYAYGERLCFGPQAASDRLSLRTAFESFLPWLVSGAQAWQSPGMRMDELALSDWLEGLVPPPEQDDQSSTFDAWLAQLTPAIGGSMATGFVLARAALESSALRVGPVAALLPQVALIQCLALMHTGKWQGAANLFGKTLPLVESHGLPTAWESALRRCVERMGASASPARLESWVKTGCNESMQAWMTAAHVSRSENCRWMDCLLEIYRSLGLVNQARKSLAIEVVRQRRDVLGEEHPDTLRSMNNLASTLRVMGETAAARVMHEQALEIAVRVLGEEHPDTLRSMNNLALALSAIGETAVARTMLEQVLETRRRVLGEEHPDTLSSMNSLALTLRATGETGAARTMHKQVLETRRRVLGEEHPDTLSSMNSLALTLRALGETGAARTMHERVLEMRRRVLGDAHPDTLSSMSNLAATLRAMGDTGAALAMHEQVLETRRRVLGDEHPDTLASINNLANTLRAMGEPGAARAMHEQVLEIRRRVLGDEHPDTSTSMNNLANTLEAVGDSVAARAMQVKVLDVRRRVLGEEHPDTLGSKSNLAATLGRMGETAAARIMQEQVLEVHRRLLGQEHPDTLRSINNLASTLRTMGDTVAARAMHAQVLGIRRRVLGDEHPDTLTSMSNLALALGDLGEIAAARAMQEQVLQVHRKVFGDAHSQTLDSFAELLESAQSENDASGVSDLVGKYPSVARALFGQRSSRSPSQSPSNRKP